MTQLASAKFWRIIFVIQFLSPKLAYTQEISPELKIAGHRGGYYFEYPESSLSLLKFIAKKFKKDTVIAEIDLRMSKDGTIYLMHDETVDRTTDGNGKLDQLGDDYLDHLYLKTEKGEITKKRVPKFEEVLHFIKNRNINLMLDIKIPMHAEAYTLVKKYRMEHRMLALTFDMEMTKKVAKLSDQIPLSALIESESDWQNFK